MRIPHFIGLHAMQILPLIAFALSRRRAAGGARSRDAGRGCQLCNALAILLWQALRGQCSPNPMPQLVALVVWALLTAVVTWFAATRRASTRNHRARARRHRMRGVP